ncbi:MAG: copper resistance protein CopC/CopD [Actinomycetota bacterium]|nr:copper resistance protein CopC/CopD [Actinomycetota bacterium]
MARPADRAALVVLSVLILVLLPEPALAHAAFVSSQPEPGERLGTAPGVVTLRFTEPLNTKLSRATVTDPTGTEFAGRATSRDSIDIPLTTNAVGVYEVQWTTVSVVDGHTLRGSFEFGVGVTSPLQTEGEIEASPGRNDVLILIARTAEYVGLLLALGMLLLRRLARRPPEFRWVRFRLRFPLLLALTGGIGVVIGEALAASSSPSIGSVLAYVTTGLPGVARLARLASEIAAVVAVFSGGSPLWFVLTAIGGLASSGHAAAVHPAWFGISIDAAHLVAAGLWAGGILALAGLRPPGGWRGPEGRLLLRRFSPVALAAFLATVGFGTVQALQELGELRQVVTSSYGRVLLLKVGLVALMVPFSLRAWRLERPIIRGEAVAAVLVIGAAALLAAYPLPPGRLVEAEEVREAPSAVSALPREGDLTMGESAGEVLVALTLRPGQPGPNQALVYLLPRTGEKDAAGLTATFSVNGRPYRLQRCAPTCRRAQVRLRGNERVEIGVAGKTGGEALFRLPALPANDGSPVLLRAQERLHRLRTYRLDETLSSGLRTVRTRYEFQAPDRMRAEVSSGAEWIVIGGTRYSKEGERWKVERGRAGIEVPSFTWDFFRPFVAPRVVGRADVRGASAQIVSFFGRSGSVPVWFRLWVTERHLVPRAEMRAQGHFMDHRYFDFDKRARITPPL